MKYSKKKVDELIKQYSNVSVNVVFLPFLDGTWELFRSPDENTIYTVYIKYDNPKSVNLAILLSHEIIATLNPELQEEIISTEKFLFRFLALMKDLEKLYGELDIFQRKYIAEEAGKWFQIV